MSIEDFSHQLDQALLNRQTLLTRLAQEDTQAYRIFNGVSEGWAGLTIDRYGDLLLAQTFREALNPATRDQLQAIVLDKISGPTTFAYNHRGKLANQRFSDWHDLDAQARGQFEFREFGNRFLTQARHHGIDPWLFLDLRAGRRWVREVARDQTVLNLFAYTCSVGITAAAAGAREVWNVDFASSSLAVGRRVAQLNGIADERFVTIEEDCLPVMRQLAGLPTAGRRGQTRSFKKFGAREFDLVILDPPAWSKGAFGAVDVENDYPSLFKAAVLATRPGGQVLCTNHVARVEMTSWLDILQRCAAKAGRPLRGLRTLTPDEDFPSFDGNPPLKIAIAGVS